jgi:hypothetical protein
MKRAPIVFLIILISMVVISALISPDNGILSPEEPTGDPVPFRDHLSGDRSLDGQFPGTFFDQDTQLTTDDRAMLEDIITKSEIMSRRLADSIARLKQEGEDVGNMEVLLAEYTRLVSDARMYLEMSNTSSGIVPVNDSQASSRACTSEEECLASSRESLIQANTRLKSIFSELSPYLAPHAMIPENASLIAQGNGTVVLVGDMDVHISLSGGKISYMDFENDVSVQMENDVVPDVSETEAKHKNVSGDNVAVVTYNNVAGNVTLSGSGFMVEVIGDDISMSATGAGKVELFGDGIYYIEDGDIPAKMQLWKPPLFENN